MLTYCSGEGRGKKKERRNVCWHSHNLYVLFGEGRKKILTHSFEEILDAVGYDLSRKSHSPSSEDCLSLVFVDTGITPYYEKLLLFDRKSWSIFSLLRNQSNKLFLQAQLCRVLEKINIGADGHFWVKTRFGILVKGSCIWANQVLPRANLTTQKWKCPPKKPYRCSPTRWGVFRQKAI